MCQVKLMHFIWRLCFTGCNYNTFLPLFPHTFHPSEMIACLIMPGVTWKHLFMECVCSNVLATSTLMVRRAENAECPSPNLCSVVSLATHQRGCATVLFVRGRHKSKQPMQTLFNHFCSFEFFLQVNFHCNNLNNNNILVLLRYYFINVWGTD